MKAMRFILAMLGVPLLAPVLMYGATYLLAVGSGGSLSFSLTNYYQVGLPYAYGIFMIIGLPIFAVLVKRRIHTMFAFVASGMAIFPVLIGILSAYAAIKDKQVTLAITDASFVASAMFTGAVLGATFWGIAVAKHHEENTI
jgi:hypothetical protein